METSKLILIVEDESSIVDTITYALSTEGLAAHASGTAAEALKFLQGLQPEPALIVLDIGLPDRSGFDLCRQIRQISAVPIIFLTARAEEVDRILGLELGGDDYVVKPFSPRELVARIKACLRRVQGDAPKPVRQNRDFAVDPERLKILFKGQALELSRYEFRLLSILIKRPGRVYSREELMNLAWETPEMSLERTVDAHIKNIRNKLRAIDPGDDSISTQRGFGYSLREGQ